MVMGHVTYTTHDHHVTYTTHDHHVTYTTHDHQVPYLISRLGVTLISHLASWCDADIGAI